MEPIPQRNAGPLHAARKLCRTARAVGLIADWDGVPGLGAILVAGPDAGSFLQSQLTSDVLNLDPGKGQLSARLTRTGALVAHFSLHRLPERGQPFPSYLLLVPAAEIPGLLTNLDGHLVSEDVLLENVSGEFRGLVAQGPGALSLRDDVLPAFGPGALVLDRSFTGDPGWVLLASASETDQWAAAIDAARSAGFVSLNDHEAGSTAWQWLRLEAGLPLAGPDFEPGRTLLPQTGLEQQTVSATKGCYLGQEVVARVRAYGTVPRSLRGLIIHEPLSLDPQHLPRPGEALLTADGQKIGAWATTGFSVVWDRCAAMAYLDRDHCTPGERLFLKAGRRELETEVVVLPLFAAASRTEKAASLHERGVRRFSAGADREAVALLEEAIGLDPRLVEAYEALGVILGRTGAYHEAIDVFKRLEDVAPDEPMVHTNLSVFYLKIGDKDEAERQKALATMKKFGARPSGQDEVKAREAELAALHQDARRRQAMFSEVLAVDPQDGLALMGMGKALLDLNDPNGADGFLARALAAQPDNSSLYVSRGKVLELLDRTGEAAEVYRLGVAMASRKGDLMPLKELEHRLFLLSENSGRMRNGP